MSFTQLRSFVRAADAGSFSKAAARSFISTTAFAQQISLLEKSFGVKLFERTSKGVQLSAAGKSFYPRAKQILSIYDESRSMLANLAGAKDLQLRVALPEEGYPEFFYKAIGHLRRSHPEIEVSIVPCPYNDHAATIKKGLADVSAIDELNDRYLKGLHFAKVANDTYAFCMRPGHPVAKLETIRESSVAGMEITCGFYPYMKANIANQMTALGAHVTTLGTEYDNVKRLESVMTDTVLVIHAQWAKFYETHLKVVKSDIPATCVGILYQDPNSYAVQKLIEAAREEAG